MLEAPTIPPAEHPALSAEQLLEAARLSAVGGITGEVVHELNNPLFAILGLVEMLLREAEPGSKQERRLALVHETGIEMRNVARAVADFARASSDTTSGADLADAVAAAVDLTARAGATKDVEISLAGSAEPLPVSGSSAHLVAIVVDLLARLRNALPAGGTVAISLTREGDAAVLHLVAEGERVEPLTLDRGAGVAVDAAAVHVLGGSLTTGPGTELHVLLPLNRKETT